MTSDRECPHIPTHTHTHTRIHTHSRRWGRAGARWRRRRHRWLQQHAEGGEEEKEAEDCGDGGAYGVSAVLQQALGIELDAAADDGNEEEEQEEEQEARLERARARALSLLALQGAMDGGGRELALFLWSEEEEGQGGTVVSNAAWDAAFISAATVLRACNQAERRGRGVGPLGPVLLLGACVHPHDRHAFFQSLAFALFAPPGGGAAPAQGRQRWGGWQPQAGGTQIIKVR